MGGRARSLEEWREEKGHSQGHVGTELPWLSHPSRAPKANQSFLGLHRTCQSCSKWNRRTG